MHQRVSRRAFLAMAGASLAVPRELLGKDDVPRMLDHILLGTNDLDAGIAWLEKRTGVRAALGGVHPGRGTRNALVNLGEQRYLEVIAPDPQQAGTPDTFGLQSLSTPRLVTWAVHLPSAAAQAERLAAAGIDFDGPTAGSRTRPDGTVLNWQTLRLEKDRRGMLPFFIEWGADSAHPSLDAPKGCRLLRFEAASIDPDELAKAYAALGIEIRTSRADRPQLRATIAGARGEFSITS